MSFSSDQRSLSFDTFLLVFAPCRKFEGTRSSGVSSVITLRYNGEPEWRYQSTTESVTDHSKRSSIAWKRLFLSSTYIYIYIYIYIYFYSQRNTLRRYPLASVTNDNFSVSLLEGFWLFHAGLVENSLVYQEPLFHSGIFTRWIQFLSIITLCLFSRIARD